MKPAMISVEKLFQGRTLQLSFFSWSSPFIKAVFLWLRLSWGRLEFPRELRSECEIDCWLRELVALQSKALLSIFGGRPSKFTPHQTNHINSIKPTALHNDVTSWPWIFHRFSFPKLSAYSYLFWNFWSFWSFFLPSASASVSSYINFKRSSSSWSSEHSASSSAANPSSMWSLSLTFFVFLPIPPLLSKAPRVAASYESSCRF